MQAHNIGLINNVTQIDNWAKQYEGISLNKDGILTCTYLVYYNLLPSRRIRRINVCYPALNETNYNNIGFEIHASPDLQNELEDSKYLKYLHFLGLHVSQSKFRFTNSNDVKEFLTFLMKFEPTISDVLHDDIFLELRINTEFAKEAIALAMNEDLECAIKMAKTQQAKGNYEFIWELIQHLYDKESINDEAFYELLQCVHPNNPHYQDVQDQLLHIVYTGITDEDEDRNIDRLEVALGYALNSAKYNQTIVDQIFHKLCGYSSLTVITPNIKGDVATLTALAAQTRMVNKKLNEAESKVANLQYGKFYRTIPRDTNSLNEEDKDALNELKKVEIF